MEKNQLNLTLHQNFTDTVTTDWKLYELILFNLLSNAVKYNTLAGDIIIIASVDSQIDDEGPKFKLVTQVVDSGQGISNDREKMLFIPFLELKST